MQGSSIHFIRKFSYYIYNGVGHSALFAGTLYLQFVLTVDNRDNLSKYITSCLNIKVKGIIIITNIII